MIASMQEAIEGVTERREVELLARLLREIGGCSH